MFILIDKPQGVSSHFVVNKVRRITGEKRVGHGGTLDPAATGLLMVAVGRSSTKQLDFVTRGKDKTYCVTMVLGEERDTDDVTGKIVTKTDTKGLPIVSKARVSKVLSDFEGKQLQVPPDYSAVNIKGERAYKIALRGEKPVIEPREVIIYYIKLLYFRYPSVKLEVKVSSGAYVRSLARDLGRTLGTGAYVKAIKRVKIGDYTLTKAVKLSELTSNNWRDYSIGELR